ncbi:DUF3549 family protein [Marinobacterium sediminicola]|uniref:DUF3549 family protein n=1 Tax=Marinobacterium sediminicola TaxID=518898 RepID=A0ABY1RXW4_9GAMM|nr:DUF3549 family protein [Marinobacterium sediminicola]ULG68606.1 DUF3549 family protein [Marinobacterium sediminicola]SMR73126.1 Protein of unknown function [Marinobacterium sediminicola]
MSAENTLPDSLTELLRSTGAALRVFDMGRRISKMPLERFRRIEDSQLPYPTPFQHLAWLAVLIWNPRKRDENAVWFLRLPLDEQGLVAPAARDDLLKRLVQNVINSKNGQLDEDALKDNPYSFTPDQSRMAAFHALAAREMKLQASPHYERAQAWFKGQLPLEQWQSLAYQGLADFIIRLDQENNSTALCQRLSDMPAAVLEMLCPLLENIQPAAPLQQALVQQLQQALTTDNSNRVAALCRALSNITDEVAKQHWVMAVLQSIHARDPEVITVIATRCESALLEPQVLTAFLEQLAQGEAGQAGFSRILAELMFMPVHRALILQAFRNPERSEALGQAIGEMFGQSFEAPPAH